MTVAASLPVTPKLRRRVRSVGTAAPHGSRRPQGGGYSVSHPVISILPELVRRLTKLSTILVLSGFDAKQLDRRLTQTPYNLASILRRLEFGEFFLRVGYVGFVRAA
jgi:hypothetical protein